MCGEFAAQAENVRPNPGRAPGRTARVLSRQAADTLGVAVPSREQGPTKYDTLTVRSARRDDGTSHGRYGMLCRLMGNEKASKLHVQTLKLFYSPADEQERLLRFTCHADHLHLRRPYSQWSFGPCRSIMQAGSVELVIGQLVALGCKLESRHPYREQLTEGAQTVEKARPLAASYCAMSRNPTYTWHATYTWRATCNTQDDAAGS